MDGSKILLAKCNKPVKGKQGDNEAWKTDRFYG